MTNTTDHTTQEWLYAVRDGAPDRHLVSKLRITKNWLHWHIHVWNRGASAGSLTVNASDGPTLVAVLLPERLRRPRD
jgi:hypothetical protein